MAIVRVVRLWLVSRQVSPGHHAHPRLPLLTFINQLDTSSMSRDQEHFTAVALISLPGCGPHLTVTDIRVRPQHHSSPVHYLLHLCRVMRRRFLLGHCFRYSGQTSSIQYDPLHRRSLWPCCWWGEFVDWSLRTLCGTRRRSWWKPPS